MEPWLQTCKDTLDRYIDADSPVLVAVSGGLDSTVLCHVLRYFQHPFAIAHINYNLRGTDSLEDAQFVRALALQLGVPFQEKEISPEAQPTQGIQQWARDIRYDFFGMLMKEHGYNKLLLAHHKDDQTEQFFLKAMRPSGVFSLGGMRVLDGNRLRPLLHATKKELANWAQQQGIAWREDASNQKTDYKRNWWRHKGIPFLAQQYPDIQPRIETLQLHLQEAERGTDALLTFAVAQLGMQLPYGIYRIDLGAWKTQMNPEALELWLQPKGFSATVCRDIWEIPRSGESKFFEGQQQYAVEVKEDFLYLIDTNVPQRSAKSYQSIEELCEDFEVVEATRKEEVMDLSSHHLVLPDHVGLFPIHVRPVKSEDSMQPLGMQQHKKLEDLFKNAKVPYCLRKNLFTWQTKLGILYLEGVRSAELTRWSGDVEKHYIIRIN